MNYAWSSWRDDVAVSPEMKQRVLDQGYHGVQQVYGPSAWWWEVEELIRKLFLSAVVVLIESGSPLQVCV